MFPPFFAATEGFTVLLFFKFIEKWGKYKINWDFGPYFVEISRKMNYILHFSMNFKKVNP